MTEAAGARLGSRATTWALRAAARAQYSKRIALVLADVDGVITPGEGQPADLEILRRLAEHNRAALEDPETPALALCTGRQAPYVELMSQMTATFLPCIFEHGAGLYIPDAFQFVFAEELGSYYSARLAAVRAALEPEVLRAGRAFVQPGKEATLTLYRLPGTSPDVLYELVSSIVGQAGDWEVERNVAHLEVRPRGINKGGGLRHLARLLGLPLTAIAGVGDSDPDLSFLSQVGLSAAPANATPAVREAVDYVAPQPFGDGLLNILERCLTIS